MPAPAVIPAPIAYIKVVAVKKLVVGYLVWRPGPPLSGACAPVQPYHPSEKHGFTAKQLGSFTLKKLECSKQAIA